MPLAAARGVAAVVDVWLRLPRLLRAAVPIAGMGALWWSSAQQPEPTPYSVWRALLHNAMHPLVYALLGASIWLALATRPAPRVSRRRSRDAWLLASSYGIVDEVHQSFVPGRACSFADALADFAGAAMAILLLQAVVGASGRWLLPAGVCGVAALASVLLATFVPL